MKNKTKNKQTYLLHTFYSTQFQLSRKAKPYVSLTNLRSINTLNELIAIFIKSNA